MLISFIIPAYDASQTIYRCLDSIYSLPIPGEEFEVIVIDDCSNDETVAMVEEYTSSHANLILLRQKVNHRQGAARNLGLKVAKGQHIAFVDSDDMVDAGMLKALDMALGADLDMVAMQNGHVSKSGGKSLSKVLKYAENEFFSGCEFQRDNKYWFCGPCGYLYRKDFLQTVDYPFAEDVLYEDTDFVMNHLYQAKRMAYCPECCYWIFYNPQSTTHTESFRHVADYLALGVRQLTFYQRMESKTSSFAKDVLEGGVWNVNKACKHLWRLRSWRDILEFYDRVDEKRYRVYLKNFQFDSFKLTLNSHMIVNHRNITLGAAFVILPILRILKR